jgi:hypothetical protein
MPEPIATAASTIIQARVVYSSRNAFEMRAVRANRSVDVGVVPNVNMSAPYQCACCAAGLFIIRSISGPPVLKNRQTNMPPRMRNARFSHVL